MNALLHDPMDALASRAPRYVRRVLSPVGLTYAALTGFLLVYLATLLFRSSLARWPWVDGWGVAITEVVALWLCARQGRSRTPLGRATLVLAIALGCWVVGDTIESIQSIGGATPPAPSLSDLFYVMFYPAAYAAVMLYLRLDVRQVTREMWLDGLIAGSGAAAFCSAVAFHSISMASMDPHLDVIADLTYPVGDILLFALIIGAFTLLSHDRRRSRGPWRLLAGAMFVNILGDTANLFPHTFGATRVGFVLNAIAWPASIVMMSATTYIPRRQPPLISRDAQPNYLMPGIASVSSLLILFVASLSVKPGKIAIGLATMSLVFVGVRVALSVRQINMLSSERQRQALTDELTGLANRRFLTRSLERYFARVAADEQDETSLAFLFVDLDRFKEINDSFGHPAGDALLRQVSDRLTAALRRDDLLVRFGGDEFAVLLTGSDAEHAREVATRLTETLQEPFALDAVHVQVGASIGIAISPLDATDAAGLIWCADTAMYRAKIGHQPYATYRSEIDDEGDTMRLADELAHAISDGGLALHYQPQLDLRTGDILGVEALIRWHHPRLGLLPPDRFLPLAEQAGLILDLTRWVLDEACRQCAQWHAQNTALSVAVNISPSNLVDPDFVAIVDRTLTRHSLPPSAIVLEITETGVIEDLERAGSVIALLRQQGLTVSIDDFGAGATSLVYLRNLAVRELKLDRSFLAGITGDDQERTVELIRQTIELGHAMGLRIVAEGIEDTETLSLLGTMGCDYAQGYFISRPKPAEDFSFRARTIVPEPRSEATVSPTATTASPASHD